MAKQLFLDLDYSPPDVDENDISDLPVLKRGQLRQAVCAWIAGQDAAGLGLKVSTRISRYNADLAAFWNDTKRSRDWSGPHRILIPKHTMIVECRSKRQDCWPDFTKSNELLPRLRELKRQRIELEATIRKTEPHLRETATLFEEYSDWNYLGSDNKDYHSVCLEINKINKALYKGTRFEWICSANLADFLYLAVPENTVHPHELADGWGLLWVTPDKEVKLMAKAETQSCPSENRLHLVQNIATAAMNEVLFSEGIYQRKNKVTFLPKPRRRRPKRKKKGKSGSA